MLNFRILTTKNTLNSAFLMPTPTLTGGELTKSGVNLLSDYSKTKFHETTKKSAKSVLFFPKNSQFLGSKKALITDTER